MTSDAVIPLLLFMALVLALSLHGLAASGHFPRAYDRAPGPGPFLLFGSMAVVIFCVIVGIVATARLVPWYAAVIGGGVSVLSAPLMLQRFTNKFVDGRVALVVFAAVGVALALFLVSIAGASVAP